jgi:hypothetical protein
VVVVSRVDAATHRSVSSLRSFYYLASDCGEAESAKTLYLNRHSGENKIKLYKEIFSEILKYFVYIVIIQMWKVLKLVKFPQIVGT